MKRSVVFVAIVATLAVMGWTHQATAGHGTLRSRIAFRESQTYPWHGDYYDVAWGTPVALVVPPTAENQTHLGWGVGATRVTPIQHQYGRGYSESVGGGASFQPAPAQPTNTDQMGDYYIRGPW